MYKTFLAIAFLIALASVAEEAPKSPPSFADMTKTMKKLDGFFPLYWDEKQGKLFLEVSKWNQEFLYLDSLPAGIGSNDIGLDRGQMGQSHVVKLLRVGPKVLLEEVNYQFRASSADELERQSVRDAFAQSVLWGFKVAAQDGDRVLIDATDFYLHDAHHVADTIKQTKQGSYHVDPERSAISIDTTRNFPENTEVEAVLTFIGEDPGKYLRQVAPDPKAVTVRQHQSFIRLPDANYKPRRFDPRSGFIDASYADYSAPIGQPIEQRFIVPHRLRKKDPGAEVSEPVKPILYYLDPATPEPVRSALLEGASWWNAAFEAAGFKNAFRVQMLPAGADPMDVRYNMIEWVHRATRGWSYGEAVIDPRTGEIIKGHVSLGSLRMRQDYMILQGMLNSTSDPRILQTVLARLRQLAAHEVGHTIGLQHNYIASTEGRASVMDYPHPFIKLENNGDLDLSDAYATGVGAWDKVAVQYGYSEFKEGTDEPAALNAILEKALAGGIRFLTDQDARPAGSMNPYTHMWDNGTNAVDELNRILQVRAHALEHFSDNAISAGQPIALLEDVLVPIYLYHRYQLEAATKVVGGFDYTYALRGDGQKPITPVSAAEQRRALAAVLKTISPATLAIPDRLTALIPPHPSGYPRTRESFPTNTLGFDPLAAAQSAAQETIERLLSPERAERLIQQRAQDPKALGLGEALDQLLDVTWKDEMSDAKSSAIQRVVGDVALRQLMALAEDEHASPEVRAMAALKLHELRVWADAAHTKAPAGGQSKAHLFAAAMAIRNQEEGTAQPLKGAQPVEVPPGAPIGTALGTTEDGDDFSTNR